MNPAETLKKYFGYEGFRLGQREVIDEILAGRDALAIMPTGAGKSLCFQVPALLLDGITLVISPLISLMRDQVDALIQADIPAAFINSSLTTAQTHKALANARKGAYKIIYAAPERLETESFVRFAQDANIAMLAVDEAHCVSHWGQDFRPSYLGIKNFIGSLPKRPVLSAFTATATDIVRDDIIKLLGLHDPFVRSTGFNRENLYFEVRYPKKKFDELAAYLQENTGKSGIIYCATRKAVDDVSNRLRGIGIPAARYHAGMSQEERTAAQSDFLYDRVPVIAATNAFGMGIDKSNVSFVLHYNMPKNMESYYQEAGRAGRDGSPAECIILFSQQDVMVNRMLIENDIDHRRLREMEAYCNTTECLRQYILDYFQDEEKHACGNCGNCNTERELIDVTLDAQKILSCVHRMKGRYGLALVIEVLRGATTQKVKSFNLDKIKTFGAMNGRPTDEIRRIAQFLLQKGYIRQVGDRYPTVQTSETAAEVLYGNKIISMPVKPAAAVPAPEPKKAGQAVDSGLLARLKALRLKLANAEDVPAFVVFSDATLRDMCVKLPADDAAFLTVSGVGEVKLRKYGRLFIDEINQQQPQHHHPPQNA